ncbi:MAG TPA: biopolymer transporter ExbD [Terriglobales bacterium]|nr:biopolymer transporter ExbD [Terriglobales bacterium]
MPRPRQSSRRAGAIVAAPEMNVTPLVDVVLVLLIIFMVVAPRMDQEVPLTLPAVAHPDPRLAGGVDPLKISIARAGEFHLDGRQYDLDGVVAALVEARAADPLRRLAVRAAAGLRYGDVRILLERTQSLGFSGVALMASEKPPPLPELAQ